MYRILDLFRAHNSDQWRNNRYFNYYRPSDPMAKVTTVGKKVVSQGRLVYGLAIYCAGLLRFRSNDHGDRDSSSDVHHDVSTSENQQNNLQGQVCVICEEQERYGNNEICIDCYHKELYGADRHNDISY